MRDCYKVIDHGTGLGENMSIDAWFLPSTDTI